MKSRIKFAPVANNWIAIFKLIETGSFENRGNKNGQQTEHDKFKTM